MSTIGEHLKRKYAEEKVCRKGGNLKIGHHVGSAWEGTVWEKRRGGWYKKCVVSEEHRGMIFWDFVFQT